VERLARACVDYDVREHYLPAVATMGIFKVMNEEN
jgi:hypothetical protein